MFAFCLSRETKKMGKKTYWSLCTRNQDISALKTKITYFDLSCK